MNLTTRKRSFGSVGMLALFGLALVPTTATAGLSTAGQVNLGALAYSAPAAVAARAARASYYAATYADENGPYPTYDAAIQASQVTLWNSVHVWMTGESNFEQALLIFRDKYNQYWFTTPRESLETQATVSTDLIHRPECSAVAMSHSHPMDRPGMMELFPQGPNGDNLTHLDQFVQRFKGDIWYYRPNTHEPKLYGGIKDGTLSTLYGGYDAAGVANTNKLPQNVDLYDVDRKTGGDGSQVWWDRYTKGPVLLEIALVPVALSVFALVMIFGGGGGGSSTEGLPTPGLDDLTPGW